MTQQTVVCNELVSSMVSGYMHSPDIGHRRDIVKTDLLFFISSSFLPLLIFIFFLDVKDLWIPFLMTWAIAFANENFFFNLDYIKEKRSPKDFYRKQLKHIRYKGDLSDIFDLEDEIVKENIKNIKSSLINQIKGHGSISGGTLVEIIDKIIIDKEEFQKKILIEARENADTSIEKRINEINNIQ